MAGECAQKREPPAFKYMDFNGIRKEVLVLDEIVSIHRSWPGRPAHDFFLVKWLNKGWSGKIVPLEVFCENVLGKTG